MVIACMHVDMCVVLGMSDIEKSFFFIRHVEGGRVFGFGEFPYADWISSVSLQTRKTPCLLEVVCL